MRRLFIVAVLSCFAVDARAASLFISSGLHVQADTVSTGTFSISTSGTNLVITSNELFVTSLAGWSGSGTNTVTGPVSDAATGLLVLGSQATLSGTIATTGGFAFAGAPYITVLLAGDTTLSASAGGIGVMGTIDSTTDGSYALAMSVTAGGSISVSGAIGATKRPASISFSAPTGNQTTLSSSVHTLGAQTYTGQATVANSIVLTGTSISLGTLSSNGGLDLTINGDATFGGAVTTQLGSISVTGSSTFTAGGDIHTNTTQHYGAVTLASDVSFFGTTMSFGGTVNGTHALAINGNASFGASVGGATALSSLSISGTTQIAGSTPTNITTTNGQLYTGDVTLGTDSTWTGGIIETGAFVDGAHALTVVASGGYTIDSFIGTVDKPTQLTAGGTTHFTNGTINTTTSVRFTGPVVLGSLGVAITSPAVTFDGPVDGAVRLDVYGTTTFKAAVGASQPLASLFLHGATTVASAVTTSGSLLFQGALTLSAASTPLAGSDVAILGEIARTDSAQPLALGISTSGGYADIGPGATCDIVLDGTTAGTEYTQYTANAPLNLDACILKATAATMFPDGTMFTVMRGTSVSGTFASLPQGSPTMISGQKFLVDYQSNAVVLFAQAPPDASTPAADLSTVDLLPPNDLREPDFSITDAPTYGVQSQGGGCNMTGTRSSPAPIFVTALLLLALVAHRARTRARPGTLYSVGH